MFNIANFSITDHRSNTGATTTSTASASSATPTAAPSPANNPADRNKCFGQEDIYMFIVWLQHNPTRRVVPTLRFGSPQDQESPVRPLPLCGLPERNPQSTRQVKAQEKRHDRPSFVKKHFVFFPSKAKLKIEQTKQNKKRGLQNYIIYIHIYIFFFPMCCVFEMVCGFVSLCDMSLSYYFT